MSKGRLLAAIALFACMHGVTLAETAITYQGQIQNGIELYEGELDMEFSLFDQPTGGAQVGSTIKRTAVPVADGLFQVELDFGESFGAKPLYLEVAVLGEVLSPRQRLTAAPQAVHALSASEVSMSLEELGDVDTSGAVDGEYLKFDGANWIAAPDSGGSNWSEGVDGLSYADGNIAIGTAGSPSSRLLVVGDGTQGVIAAESPEGDTKLQLGGNGGLSVGSGLDPAPDNGLLVGGDAVFDIGDVGIGVDDAAGIKKNLHLIHDQYTGISAGGLAIENEYNNAQWVLYSSQSSSDLSLYFNNGLRGAFDSTSGAYQALSDDRMKRNARVIESSLDKLMRLEPRKYEFLGKTGEYHYGFMAQDLSRVIPEVVSLASDDGSGQGDIYTVSYTEIIPILVSGMQEQQATIESLRRDLEALKAEVADLKN